MKEFGNIVYSFFILLLLIALAVSCVYGLIHIFENSNFENVTFWGWVVLILMAAFPVVLLVGIISQISEELASILIKNIGLPIVIGVILWFITGSSTVSIVAMSIGAILTLTLEF